MNRRDFMKFLGKAIVASGVALAARLPEVSIKDDSNVPIDFESGSNDGPTIAKWDGNTWSRLGFYNSEVDHLYMDADGTIYAGGEF